MVQHGEPNVGGIFGAVGLGLVLITVAVVFAIIHKFTTDFVVPIMFLRRTRCLTAWKELWTLLSFHAGQFILYLLFSIVLAMAIAGSWRVFPKSRKPCSTVRAPREISRSVRTLISP